MVSGNKNKIITEEVEKNSELISAKPDSDSGETPLPTATKPSPTKGDFKSREIQLTPVRG